MRFTTAQLNRLRGKVKQKRAASGDPLVPYNAVLEFRNCGDDRADRLGLAPVRVSASLSHEKYTLK